MKIIYFFIIFSLILFGSDLAAKTVSPIEKQLSKYIDAHQNETLHLLETIVNINSGSTHIQGVRAVGELLRPYFEKCGFKTYWVEEPAAMQRAGTLFAERTGHSGKRLLLIAHLDT